MLSEDLYHGRHKAQSLLPAEFVHDTALKGNHEARRASAASVVAFVSGPSLPPFLDQEVDDRE